MIHTAESLRAAFRYLFPDEVKALKDLARILPDNPVVVNIGAGAGTSGLAFMESRDDLFLYTVDIQADDSPLGCLTAEAEVIRAAGFIYNDMEQYPNRGVQFHFDSKELGKRWANVGIGPAGRLNKSRVDLVFIDGDHSYKGCKGDITAWLPNLKPGGIMAVHDYDKRGVYGRDGLPGAIPHPSPWPGVDRAVRKFLCPKYEIVLQADTLIAFRVE